MSTVSPHAEGIETHARILQLPRQGFVGRDSLGLRHLHRHHHRRLAGQWRRLPRLPRAHARQGARRAESPGTPRANSGRFLGVRRAVSGAWLSNGEFVVKPNYEEVRWWVPEGAASGVVPPEHSNCKVFFVAGEYLASCERGVEALRRVELIDIGATI